MIQKLKKIFYLVILTILLFKIYYNRYIYHFLIYTKDYEDILLFLQKYPCIDGVRNNKYRLYFEDCSPMEVNLFEDYNKVEKKIEVLFDFGYISVENPGFECNQFFAFGSGRGICYRDTNNLFNYRIIALPLVIIDTIPFSSCVMLRPSCILIPYFSYPLFGKWEKFLYPYGISTWIF